MKNILSLIVAGTILIGMVLLVSSFSTFILENEEQFKTEIASEEVDDELDGIVLLVDGNKALINGTLMRIDAAQEKVAPFTVNGQTMVPVQFIANQIGIHISWNNQTAEISFNRIDEEQDNQVAVAMAHSPETHTSSEFEIMHGKLFVSLSELNEILGMHVYENEGMIVISDEQVEFSEKRVDQLISELSVGLPYKVYEHDTFIKGFASIEQAEALVSDQQQATTIYFYSEKVWDRFDRYKVVQEVGDRTEFLQHFEQYHEALSFSKSMEHSKILFRDFTLWQYDYDPHQSYAFIEDVPLILQYPELPRGCEVTSLAMLLNFAGVGVNKLDLAQEIGRDPTPFSRKDGVTTFGNPYDGFVGDMYSLSTAGLGAYHGPIRDLAEAYLPGRIVDMTGAAFEDILQPVSQGVPVWVIVTSTYDLVPENEWYVWHTPSGDVRITYRMHSVLITGYDDQFIYVNDPFGIESKLPRQSFQRGWEQIGSQAITYVPE
ncbi:C39 family peptidase [Bacillus horti]|uniref:Uncharacterized protein YvpB n=1 Tax=Caldalkalibacillus horti TaxID=77523 RepID=A0ABT9VYZ1_9BACI|nr:C39 family peptidase [Bacillus horti]MDQ0166213.1 uncharacterized protein YvpB [Bacillus horti]